MYFRIVILLLIVSWFSHPLQAQQPEPVMDYATLLTAFDVRPDGRLRLENDNAPLTAVFLPANADVKAVVTKVGSGTPLHVQDFYKVEGNRVFTFLESRGKYKEFKFTEPGDYELKFQSGNKVLTNVPFTLFRKSNNDEFDPATVWYTKGLWNDLAYIHYLRGKGENANVEFRMWGQRPQIEPDNNADRYDVVLKKDGDLIAEAKTGHVGTKYWLRLHFQLRNPQSKGGRMFTVKDLSARDGAYQFVVSKNGKLHAVFPLEVKNGKPVLHPQQASTYQPRTNYIIPRYSNMHAGINDIGDTYWMSRMPADAAQRVAKSGAAEVAGPSPEQLKRWNWLPRTIDPKRPFDFNVTEIETRTDTGLAVGEDLAVFGVGHPNGVKYMKVGDSTAREIPEGETWSSKIFGACGHKIILTRKNQVAVFDTRNQSLYKIPTSEVSLYNPSNRTLHCNGFLVTTVNKATDVNDRTIIKIVDVSQDEPKIIPIKNANYTHDQVTSVAVDAKNGIVAIASRAKKQISAAKVAPFANQHLFDVGEYMGIGEFEIAVEGELVTYADSKWKVRQLKLGGQPRAITQEPIARSGNGFWVRKGRVVVATKTDKVGNRYPMMISDSDGPPRLVPRTGEAIRGTSAHLGLGGSAAIAIDKTVFIAGTAGQSIGKGARLQILSDDGWTPILGKDGKPIWGSEVVTSMGFMALKIRNEAGKSVIGYATYGEHVSLPNLESLTANRTRPEPSITKLEFADDNPYATNDENTSARLKAYLENEKLIAEAYIPAFGKEAGSKKVVDGTVKAMKNAGDDSLVDDYLRMSVYVAENDRPSKATSRDDRPKSVMDPAAVNEYLNGEWTAIRFSAKGQDLPDEAIENIKLTFGNGRFVLNMGSELQTGAYIVDTASSPMSMTINIESGTNKGQSRHGSFKLLKDKRLLMVFSINSTDRPTRFIPDETGNSFLAVYQKQ